MKKIIVGTLQEFNDHFNNHPAIQKALKEKKKKPPKSKPKEVMVPEGMPESFATAMAADERVADLVDTAKRVTDCLAEAIKIIRERIKTGKHKPFCSASVSTNLRFAISLLCGFNLLCL